MKIKEERWWSFFVIVLGLVFLNLVSLFHKIYIIKEIITLKERITYEVLSLVLICIDFVLYIKHFEQKYELRKSLVNYKTLVLVILYVILQLTVSFIVTIPLIQFNTFIQ